MTNKYLSGAYPGGYALNAKYTGLVIESTATVGRHGVSASFSATIANYGTVTAAGFSSGIYLGDGGTVTNGSATDTGAYVGGRTGVRALGAPATVANFGTITNPSPDSVSEGLGVYLGAGGAVTNGSAIDTTALIYGYRKGILVGGATANIANYGTISSVYYGVYLKAGGTVTNGSASDAAAYITSFYGGVFVEGAAASIANFGTITGGHVDGVFLKDVGSVTNGSAADTAASIRGGYDGVGSNAAATIVNFGRIQGLVSSGVNLAAGGTVTNGSANDTTALIQGYQAGVTVYGAQATITNFGTIAGRNGTALRFASAGDVLVVEAGSAFQGSVLGGGGTLELANGTGLLIGLLAGGNVRVSGSMAPTTFSNFGTVEIGSKGHFTTAGAVTIAAGLSVIDFGSLTFAGVKNTVANAGLIETSGSSARLTIDGALANTGTLSEDGGTLTVMGAVTGAGSVTIKGGTLDFASSFTENVTFGGFTGILELAQSQGYNGTITGFSHSGRTSLDLADIGFVSSTEATFSGTKTGGILTVTDGTHTAHITLKGDYLGSTFTASSDGHGGTIIVDPTAVSATTAHRFVAAAAGIAGPAGGALHTGEVWSIREPVLVRPPI